MQTLPDVSPAEKRAELPPAKRQRLQLPPKPAQPSSAAADGTFKGVKVIKGMQPEPRTGLLPLASSPLPPVPADLPSPAALFLLTSPGVCAHLGRAVWLRSRPAVEGQRGAQWWQPDAGRPPRGRHPTFPPLPHPQPGAAEAQLQILRLHSSLASAPGGHHASKHCLSSHDDGCVPQALPQQPR